MRFHEKILFFPVFCQLLLPVLDAGETAPAVSGAGNGNAPYQYYIVEALSNLKRSDAPPPDGERGGILRIVAAQEEYEAASFVLHPLRAAADVELTEEQFTPFSALIGAGPAYVFDLMEGLVMAGVTLGFSHAQSRSMVTELFAGCAKMAAENPAEHLMAMRDNVCSPAGLTIAGVNAMNEEGLSAKLGRAVLKANERGREMED